MTERFGDEMKYIYSYINNLELDNLSNRGEISALKCKVEFLKSTLSALDNRLYLVENISVRNKKFNILVETFIFLFFIYILW